MDLHNPRHHTAASRRPLRAHPHPPRVTHSYPSFAKARHYLGSLRTRAVAFNSFLRSANFFYFYFFFFYFFFFSQRSASPFIILPRLRRSDIGLRSIKTRQRPPFANISAHLSLFAQHWKDALEPAPLVRVRTQSYS